MFAPTGSDIGDDEFSNLPNFEYSASDAGGRDDSWAETDDSAAETDRRFEYETIHVDQELLNMPKKYRLQLQGESLSLHGLAKKDKARFQALARETQTAIENHPNADYTETYTVTSTNCNGEVNRAVKIHFHRQQLLGGKNIAAMQLQFRVEVASAVKQLAAELDVAAGARPVTIENSKTAGCVAGYAGVTQKPLPQRVVLGHIMRPSGKSRSVRRQGTLPQDVHVFSFYAPLTSQQLEANLGDSIIYKDKDDVEIALPALSLHDPRAGTATAGTVYIIAHDCDYEQEVQRTLNTTDGQKRARQADIAHEDKAHNAKKYKRAVEEFVEQAQATWDNLPSADKAAIEQARGKWSTRASSSRTSWHKFEPRCPRPLMCPVADCGDLFCTANPEHSLKIHFRMCHASTETTTKARAVKKACNTASEQTRKGNRKREGQPKKRELKAWADHQDLEVAAGRPKPSNRAAWMKSERMKEG